MKYARILMAVASEIWAMQPEKLEAMIDFLAMQANGSKYDAADIEARIAPQTAAAVARREGAVAVLPLRGVIANRVSMMTDISGGTSAEGFGRAFRSALADDDVKAIVLDVDSPGGVVHGVEELSMLIHASRGKKPVVAQVNATAASAAYWIASAADEIVVTPSGWVGSIGAMGAHDDVSAALEKLGVKKTVIASSEFKAELASHMPLSDAARDHMQQQCLYYDAMFVDRIASNRGVSPAAIRSDFGKGRMVVAGEAVKRGMVDRIATMDETLARFGVSPGAARASSQVSSRRSFATEREKRALELI